MRVKSLHALWELADWIPYFVPTQFQESIFPPLTRPKIPALVIFKPHLRIGPEVAYILD